MPKFTLDPVVEEELWSLLQFIAQNNPDAATGLIEAVFSTFHVLAANPGLGRLRKFKNSQLSGIRSFRVTGFNNYLIFYRQVAGGIQVHHVYHGARDLESLFSPT